MPELVLYGIKLLAKPFLGSILDMEVDQSGLKAGQELPGQPGSHLATNKLRGKNTGKVIVSRHQCLVVLLFQVFLLNCPGFYELDIMRKKYPKEYKSRL